MVGGIVCFTVHVVPEHSEVTSNSSHTMTCSYSLGNLSHYTSLEVNWYRSTFKKIIIMLNARCTPHTFPTEVQFPFWFPRNSKPSPYFGSPTNWTLLTKSHSITLPKVSYFPRIEYETKQAACNVTSFAHEAVPTSYLLCTCTSTCPVYPSTQSPQFPCTSIPLVS